MKIFSRSWHPVVHWFDTPQRIRLFTSTTTYHSRCHHFPLWSETKYQPNLTAKFATNFSKHCSKEGFKYRYQYILGILYQIFKLPHTTSPIARDGAKMWALSWRERETRVEPIPLLYEAISKVMDLPSFWNQPPPSHESYYLCQ